MLNFRSLAAAVSGTEDEKSHNEGEHIEHAAPQDQLKEPSPTSSPRVGAVEGNRGRGDSAESTGSSPPPIYVEQASDGDRIEPAPVVRHSGDEKNIGQVGIWGTEQVHEATQ
jgi:hypothetical protein